MKVTKLQEKTTPQLKQLTFPSAAFVFAEASFKSFGNSLKKRGKQ